MTEPSTTGAAGAALVAIASALVGAQLGPVTAIAAAAMVGALVSLGEVTTTSRLHAFRYVITYVLMAVVVTGAVSWLIQHFTGISEIEILSLVAFTIGWVGNRWGSLRTAVVSTATSIISRDKDPGDHP